MSEIAGSTPEQYALKVRTHPGVLQISATNKIRTAVNVNISWSGVLIESYKLSKRSQDINANLDNLNKFISSFSSESIDKKGNFLWNNITASNIISFIGNFIAPENPIASPSRLAEFILENRIVNSGKVMQHAQNPEQSLPSLFSSDNVCPVTGLSIFQKPATPVFDVLVRQ